MGTDVPFTVDADLELGRSARPWLRGPGADVRIRRGAVPTALRGVEAKRGCWECAGERVLVHKGGMRFLVEGGRSISYAAPPSTDPLDLRLFLMGAPWLALAVQRGLLPLHGSAVAHAADVHAFCGPMKAGKSTLAAALSARGHAFFADDSLLLDIDRATNDVRCYAYKDLKLSGTSAELTRLPLGSPVSITEDRRKHYVEPPRRSPHTAGRLKGIYLLGSNSMRRDAEVAALAGLDAVRALHWTIHRLYLVAAIVGAQRLADWMVELARRVDVHLFRHGMDESRFHSILATIAAALPSPCAQSSAVPSNGTVTGSASNGH